MTTRTVQYSGSTIFLKYILFLLLMSIFIISCSGDSTDSLPVDAGNNTNTPPQVNIGTDQTITIPTNSVRFNPNVTDDGLPAGSSLTYTWTQKSGPASATFTGADVLQTTAAFDNAGTYVLELAVSDTELLASDTVAVTVLPEPDGETHLLVDFEDSPEGNIFNAEDFPGWDTIITSQSPKFTEYINPGENKPAGVT